MSTAIPHNGARMTPSEMATATSGVLRMHGAPVREIVGLASDSRNVVPGCAFVALRGEKYDGHDFLRPAIENGAALVVTAQPGEPVFDALLVPDTLVAWGDLARAHLRKWRRLHNASRPARTVAITGSAGKTTTKDMCAALLALVAPTHATAGNLNNRVGVPAVAFGVEAEHRFAVFEAGMSVPGEMASLGGILEPDVAVLLNVGVAHAGGVGGGRAEIAREKGALLEALPRIGCAVVNADDELASAQLVRARAEHRETFGRSDAARYRLVERVPCGRLGSRLIVERPRGSGRERISVVLPVPGEAAALDFVAALAAAEAAHGEPISAELLGARAPLLSITPGRAMIRTLAGNVVVFDDSYNANPASMRAALETVFEIARTDQRRFVAVLGEMKELGALAEQEHEALGDVLGQCNVSLAIGCGGLIDLTLDRAASRGTRVFKARSTEQAAEAALGEVQAGDVVLLKGSRSTGVELVLRALQQLHGIVAAVER